MTPEEARHLAERIKARRRGGGEQRAWPRSELDRYEKEIVLLHLERLTNAEIAGWLRRQKPRVNSTATKIKFWLGRHGYGKTPTGEEPPADAAPDTPPEPPSDDDGGTTGNGRHVKMSKPAA